jgi:hypothetical protein
MVFATFESAWATAGHCARLGEREANKSIHQKPWIFKPETVGPFKVVM